MNKRSSKERRRKEERGLLSNEMINGKNKLPNARCITKFSTEESEDGLEVGIR